MLLFFYRECKPKPHVLFLSESKVNSKDYVQNYIDNLGPPPPFDISDSQLVHAHHPPPIDANVVVSNSQVETLALVTPSSAAPVTPSSAAPDTLSSTNMTGKVNTSIKSENPATSGAQNGTAQFDSTITSSLNPAVPIFSTGVHTPMIPPISSTTTITAVNEQKGQQNVEGASVQMSGPSSSTQHSVQSVSKSQPTKTTEQSLIELAKSLADQVSLNRLPPPEPSIFYGDPIQYPAWKAAFKTLIDQRCIPAAERIYYLKRYIGGSVKQVVENYFLLSSDNAYDDARHLLDERYGDPFVLASAFRSKLDHWPRVAAKDSKGLLTFSDFLKQCLSAMETNSGLNILNDSCENRKILGNCQSGL